MTQGTTTLQHAETSASPSALGASAGAAAGAVTGLLVLLVDASLRTRWGAGGVTTHMTVMAPLLVTLGIACGTAVAVVGSGWRTLTNALGGGAKESINRAGIAVAVSVASALWLSRIAPKGALRTSWIVPLVPWIGAFVVGAATLGWIALERSRSRRRRAALVAASVAAGVGLFYLDANVLVGTHARVHVMLEALGVLLSIGALHSIFVRIARGMRSGRVFCPLAGAVAFACPAIVITQLANGAPYVREARHLLYEPTALGSLVTGITGLGTPPPAPRETNDRWAIGEQESLAEKDALLRLRADYSNYNIVVYLVDTLRADTAHDAETMPNLGAFAAQSLAFDEAYSTASDTLQALQTLLAGRYDSGQTPSFLQRAHEANVDTALFIASSARSYLEAQLPEFRFDETFAIADHSPEKSVWGYGADMPTGDALAERAIEWMASRHDRRFLAWVYNYDLHGWRDLRDDLLDPRPPSGCELEVRYRYVAKAVDRSLGRVLQGLRELGLDERTVVFFVSDHGEALGYRGFAAHSAFLWQPLVRVPLVVHIPGLEPRAVARKVSIVDVGPTVARFLEPTMTAPYHGIDLLRLYADPDTERALPLLMRASSEGRPSMLGLVHHTRKLVMPVAGGPAQLHDLTVEDPDETDLASVEAEQALELLTALISSPVSIR
jgi:hypothetical protein